VASTEEKRRNIYRLLYKNSVYSFDFRYILQRTEFNLSLWV